MELPRFAHISHSIEPERKFGLANFGDFRKELYNQLRIFLFIILRHAATNITLLHGSMVSLELKIVYIPTLFANQPS